MGRQDSLIQLRGSVGNLSFYKTQDGYLARKRTGVTGDRFKTDPKFQRIRENAAEFTRAGQATRLIRSAFRTALLNVADNRVTSRLVATMLKVIHTDPLSARGERHAANGEIGLLQDFDFNEGASLKTTFRAPYAAVIDRAAGTMVVDIPAFSPAEMIAIPAGVTHFRLKAGGAEIDFAGDTHSVAISESEALPLVSAPQGPLQLAQAVTPASTNHLILTFGIEFLQLVNGIHYPLKSGSFNAMAIVKVDRGVTS